MKPGTLAIALSVLLLPATLRAETVADYLREFHANPAVMMERLPSEVDAKGNATPRGYIDEGAVERTFGDRKVVRDQIMGRRIDTAIIGGGDANSKDMPERLVEPGTLLKNLREIDARRLQRSQLPVVPWADSYWPMYRGLIAHRYADKSFPKSKSWAEANGYVESHPASSIVASGDAALIDTLSPAEKYDFVMGDYSFSLTNYSWNTGRKHYNETGTVATWMGICHGWSGANHMNAAITEAPVQVIAANGTPVTFYPQDVKALESMLWANASPATRFVGNRCDTPKPPKNAYGRILDPACFDANPATWHLAIVTQLGLNQRSFVMDSTYDAQVWNFSVANYSYRYFNPQTFQETTSLAAAAIPIERFTLDKFREFRTPGARYIVGVAMDTSHVNAINPTRANKVEPPLKTVRFIYDLELDANYNVLGGEWYSNAHPDFIWTFDKSAQALSAGDASVSGDPWTLSSPVPSNWAAAAQRSSARGAPLYNFISRLVQP